VKVVTFGEIMLRLSPPGFERFFQTPMLSASFGGAEANVAVSLSRFGLDSWFVSRLPQHAIGQAAIQALRAEGVQTAAIVRGGSRVGIYFAETGSSQRPSMVIYDRAHSAVVDLKPEDIDWRDVFRGAEWFHVTGITPALGPVAAQTTKVAVEAARACGLRISVDLNFRRKLWTPEQAQSTMPAIIDGIDTIIANEEDLQNSLGVRVIKTDVTANRIETQELRDAAREVAKRFRVRLVAISLRESLSASENYWSGLVWDQGTGQMHDSERYHLTLVDRIGAGDSFAAGLIYGQIAGYSVERSLRFAVISSALKHTIPGDFNRVGVEEVERLMAGDVSGRVQR
jgi:2-dehydro-3-deoxygluconokinase